MAKSSVTEMLGRAVEIAEAIERIEGDVGLQKLSKAAWTAQARALAGDVDLDEVKAKIAGRRHLEALITNMATLYIRNGQDRPVLEGAFDDPDREVAAFVERTTSGATVGECSALLALAVAERLPPEYWGRLSSFDEPAAMLKPLRGELVALDHALSMQAMLRDLAWLPDGRPALNLPGGGQLAVDGENVTTLASAAAAMVRVRLISGARLAA